MIELFRTAATRQTDIMVQNILGNGIDIPLLGLREASREVEGDLHELFTDESYKISQCFLLSTSQVKQKTDFFLHPALYVSSTSLLHIFNKKNIFFINALMKFAQNEFYFIAI